MSEITSENNNKKRGLGRGLGSLLGGVDAQPQGEPSVKPGSTYTVKIENSKTNVVDTQTKVPVDTQAKVQLDTQSLDTQVVKVDEKPGTDTNLSRIWQIAIEKIQPGEYQPRSAFDKVALEELAQSIRENGILQPLTLRKISDNKYEIIAGERRWRAAQIAGLQEVPAIFKETTDQQALQLALIENIQRQDLDPIEEALGYWRLMEEFKLTQQVVSEKVGKERATVANALRLLSLPGDLQKMIRENILSVGHAKVLLGLKTPEEQTTWAIEASKQKWPVRKLELAIKKGKDAVDEPAKPEGRESLIAALADDLQKQVGTKTKIQYAQGTGSIQLFFYSDEELNRLVDAIREGFVS